MEANLDLGDYAYRFAGGADILRGTWPGWTTADTAKVKSLFNDVYWPATGAGGVTPGPANKGTLTLAAAMAIAVFDDDRAKFDHVLYLFRTAASCALPNTLPSGEIGESARDQGHAYGQLISMAFLAEVAWKQGVDVYAEVSSDAVDVFVRDRGEGFSLDEVPQDRYGVRRSILDRMERHGGTAEVRSSPGAGTEVRLHLPRPRSEETP